MSFVLSKLLWPLLAPANFVAMLAVIGVGLQLLGGRRWRRTGLALSAGVVALWVALTMLPVWAWVLLPLEARFPQPVWPDRVDGVVVLGGSVDTSATAAWKHPTVNHAADRLVEFAWLAKRYPQARLVFTGGSGSLSSPEQREAPVARAVLERMGAPVERMVFEDRSRNTLENVVFTRDLMQPKPGETWVLITSAYHMPRAVGIFRKNGWPVLPAPVGYYTGLDDAKEIGPNLAKDLYILDDAVHEWVGLAAYWLLGRTDALFPGPD
ncbi:MAG: YdcF family protein [Rhodospirillaceae bacterium]